MWKILEFIYWMLGIISDNQDKIIQSSFSSASSDNIEIDEIDEIIYKVEGENTENNIKEDEHYKRMEDNKEI